MTDRCTRLLSRLRSTACLDRRPVRAASAETSASWIRLPSSPLGRNSFDGANSAAAGVTRRRLTAASWPVADARPRAGWYTTLRADCTAVSGPSGSVAADRCLRAFPTWAPGCCEPAKRLEVAVPRGSARLRNDSGSRPAIGLPTGLAQLARQSCGLGEAARASRPRSRPRGLRSLLRLGSRDRTDWTWFDLRAVRPRASGRRLDASAIGSIRGPRAFSRASRESVSCAQGGRCGARSVSVTWSPSIWSSRIRRARARRTSSPRERRSMRPAQGPAHHHRGSPPIRVSYAMLMSDWAQVELAIIAARGRTRVGPARTQALRCREPRGARHATG